MNRAAESCSEPDGGLLACCRILAEHIEKESFVRQLENLQNDAVAFDRKRLFEEIATAARGEGLRSVVLRARKEQFLLIAAMQPVAVEMTDGRYLVVSSRGQGNSDAADTLVVTTPCPATRAESRQQAVNPAEFLQQWTGGVLYFVPVNTALVCFSIVAQEHKIELTQERLRHEYGLGTDEIERDTLLRMCKDHGLKARKVVLDWQQVFDLKKAFPVIARLRSGRHVVVAGVIGHEQTSADAQVACYDPLAGTNGGHIRLKQAEFESIWDGDVYVIKRHYRLTDDNQPFSLRWFVPEILKQKTAFVDIALAVLFINAIALITPIFFQIVIDKVLVNHALTTLHVLGMGMAAMLLVNACLDFLRDYLLLHATNKIDLRVTARTFRHMLHLPLGFFERVTAGVLTKHMQQTSSIRSFLTGNVFLTMLEATSLFIFLPFLFFYSIQLTCIVLVVSTLIALVMVVLIRPFKRRLNALYDAEGNRQAMLVETINGMATVKAMAIEPKLRKEWEEKVARAIGMQFRVGKISITAKSLTGFLERIMVVILIWVGAGHVFSGAMTVGALIAFQMLAGRVTSPLVRLVGLIHQYQEAALSVEKLGVVMNAKTEWGADRHGARPPLKGDIEFDRVGFRYAPDLPEVLKDISFTIPAGSMLGVVGPSGSGKTTLTRMLQKAYFPTSGIIRINNCYLNELDTAYLRRNTGVVLQESFLFRASVADNIRAGQAAATREQIIQAALLAGADEFIVKLPHGYDTLLEEGASNLSGGQRQRLGIARALLTRPEILIFDEATSALDPESERIIRENLGRIGRNRTVIIVSHRLSMLKGADRIVVLDDGAMVGLGAHDELLQSCDLYRTLWREQMELV
ncbi:peptidase domain-containing ABC transporter [Desulfofustis glycolicus]|uniref:ATP-binding cassette, subfamily B n=1 Tax=Desulfofustis glycolicus DSM 9705 TaxID=1121409 RepID=A0A1M5YNN9_9BACT|nr:peptidase domain-containing ABC transporter [Desulfofustis glycolicus]MCB2217805.1 peptidase domain-containing ABC transporter [Desulfobulbaceae bacterium]SHI13725.1 ATP-binding cassette, subfamily B [Desulfofustis glycolicus DSM 9705]